MGRYFWLPTNVLGTGRLHGPQHGATGSAPSDDRPRGRGAVHHPGQLASSRLRRTAWNLRDNFVVFATDRSGGEAPSMSSRFVAIDEGPDITLDRAMIVVGRHPNCDTRLNSLRVSRHHCCMTRENDQVVV